MPDAVKQLLAEVKATQTNSRAADRAYAAAFRALNAATRIEKKAKEAAFEAHKDEINALRAVLEHFVKPEEEKPTSIPS